MVDIRSTVQSAQPKIPFGDLSRSVLGERYELSLVICGDTLATRMNTEYRKKSYSPNVLSFSLEKDAGEIFLNIRKAEREARAFDVTVRARVALLFVHGLYHLKGFDHGDKMHRLEMDTLKKFRLSS